MYSSNEMGAPSSPITIGARSVLIIRLQSDWLLMCPSCACASTGFPFPKG